MEDTRRWASDTNQNIRFERWSGRRPVDRRPIHPQKTENQKRAKWCSNRISPATFVVLSSRCFFIFSLISRRLHLAVPKMMWRKREYAGRVWGERNEGKRALDRGPRLTESATPGALVTRRSGGFDGSDARKVSRKRRMKESKKEKRRGRKKKAIKGCAEYLYGRIESTFCNWLDAVCSSLFSWFTFDSFGL